MFAALHLTVQHLLVTRGTTYRLHHLPAIGGATARAWRPWSTTHATSPAQRSPALARRRGVCESVLSYFTEAKEVREVSRMRCEI